MSIDLNQLPRSITESSQNESNSVGHTHAIDKASIKQAGIVKLVDNLDSTSKTEALTANQGRELAERLSLLAQSNGSKEINERLESALSYLATRYTAAYATYETAKDNLCKHPENSLIYVVNDPTKESNGLWTVVGGRLVKAPWDALSSALTSEAFEVLQSVLQGAAGEKIEYEGKTYDTLATLTQVLEEGRTYIQDVLIDLAQSNNFTASYLLTASGKFQEEINDLTGAPYRVKDGGYRIGERVVLNNGDIVRNIVAGNMNDPNTIMTGWVNVNAASQIVDESGKNQQQINDEVSEQIDKIGSLDYLSEQLDQIAVDKGWDASFVVDGDKTQKQINDNLLGDNGSEFVNLTLSNVANAVKKNLHDVVYDQLIDVTWFGAIGNWNKHTQTGHNSTTAVQNAIAYLATLGTRRTGGKRGLKFPKGSFRVDYMDLPAALSFGIDIIGEGLYTTTLYFDQNQTREAIKCEIESVQFIGMTLVGSLNEVQTARTAGFVGKLPSKHADIDVKFLNCAVVYWATFAQIYGRGCIFEGCTIGGLHTAMEIVVTPDQYYNPDNSHQMQSEWATMRHYVFRNCRFDIVSRAYKVSGTGNMLNHINNMLFVGNDITGADILVDAPTAEISNSLFASNTALASFSSIVFRVKAFHATNITDLVICKVANYSKALSSVSDCLETFVIATAPCSHLTISGNTIRGIRRSVFTNTSATSSRNITISGNQLPDFGSFRGDLTQTVISNQPANCKGLVIVGNNCESKAMDNNFYLFTPSQLAEDVAYSNNSANFTWRDTLFRSDTVQVYVNDVASTGTFTSRSAHYQVIGDYIHCDIGVHGRIPEISGNVSLGLPVAAIGSMPTVIPTVSGTGSVISSTGVSSEGYTWANVKVNPATQRIELQKQKDMEITSLSAADIPGTFRLVISFKYKFK